MVYALHVKGKWKCKTISTALNELLTRFGYSEYFCRRFFCQPEREDWNKTTQNKTRLNVG